MAEPPVPAAVLRQRRDQTIARLGEHFALDHLEIEELEERIDRAHRAATTAELEALLADLPALQRPAPAPELRDAGAPRGGARRHQVVAALMGGAERRGAWTPARSVYVIACMGGVLLDFRTARLEPGVTEVFILAVMGGVEVIVPPGVQVDSSGIGIMGGFGDAGHGRFPVDTSVPVLRISGLALMGGVEITERAPGESAEEARRRRRDERRRLRGRPHRLGDGEPR